MFLAVDKTLRSTVKKELSHQVKSFISHLLIHHLVNPGADEDDDDDCS